MCSDNATTLNKDRVEFEPQTCLWPSDCQTSFYRIPLCSLRPNFIQNTHMHIHMVYISVWISPTKAVYKKSKETKVTLKTENTAQGFFPKPLCWVRANTKRGFPCCLGFESNHKHACLSKSHKKNCSMKKTSSCPCSLCWIISVFYSSANYKRYLRRSTSSSQMTLKPLLFSVHGKKIKSDRR